MRTLIDVLKYSLTILCWASCLIYGHLFRLEAEKARGALAVLRESQKQALYECNTEKSIYSALADEWQAAALKCQE